MMVAVVAIWDPTALVTFDVSISQNPVVVVIYMLIAVSVPFFTTLDVSHPLPRPPHIAIT